MLEQLRRAAGGWKRQRGWLANRVEQVRRKMNRDGQQDVDEGNFLRERVAAGLDRATSGTIRAVRLGGFVRVALFAAGVGAEPAQSLGLAVHGARKPREQKQKANNLPGKFQLLLS